MKREHTAQKTEPARTIFKLSQEEVIEGLTNYIKDKLIDENKVLPTGSFFVWLRSEQGSDNWFVTLGVTHDIESGDIERDQQ